MSQVTEVAVMPRSVRWLTACCRPCSWRAVIATLAPASPSASAICRPRPRLPPVTNATLPSRRNVSRTPIGVESKTRRSPWMLPGGRAIPLERRNALRTQEADVDRSSSIHIAPRALSQANLSALAGQVAIPTYNRGQLQPSIVHMGVGGFHRAHQALYLDALAERRITMDWGERGVGLLPGDRRMADALIPQECLYTLVARSAEGDVAQVIGSLTAYAFAPAATEQVLQMMADPATRIVSLTVTEGGYNVDDKT